jgi:hypothetical protein
LFSYKPQKWYALTTADKGTSRDKGLKRPFILLIYFSLLYEQSSIKWHSLGGKRISLDQTALSHPITIVAAPASKITMITINSITKYI